MSYYTTEEILGADDDSLIFGAQMMKVASNAPRRAYMELARAGGAPVSLPDVQPAKKSLFSRVPKWALYGAGALGAAGVGLALYRRGRR